MRLRLALAFVLLPLTAGYAQHTNRPAAPPTAKQFNVLAARNANQALDMTAVPSALPPQPIIPGADANAAPGLSTPGLYDSQSSNPDLPAIQPYDPGSIHYPYGRTSLGTVDPASRANPYGPYSSTPDSNTTYGHYSGPTLPQTPNALFSNPAPAFGFNPPSFGANKTPAFSRGR